jgi:superoxide dismutase, Cu-Zn family
MKVPALCWLADKLHQEKPAMRPFLALSALSLIAFTSPAQTPAPAAPMAAAPVPLVVPLKTATGADAGTASFRMSRTGNLIVVVVLKNLPPGDHAVHIHQNPVCDAPFTTAGGHFNPDGKQHGLKNPMGHHNGDLGDNMTVGADGTATFTYRVNYLTLAPGAPTSVLGHSIMVHEKGDDMMTDPTGNAGSRIACGVIPAAGM